MKFRHQLIRYILLLFLICLTGCSGHKYLELMTSETITEYQGKQTNHIESWPQSTTASLLRDCNKNAPKNALTAVNILSCNNELLGRDGLTLQQQNQALNNYNQALSIVLTFAFQQSDTEHLKIKLDSLDNTYKPEQLTLLSELQVLDTKLQYRVFGDIGVLAIGKRKNKQKHDDKFYPLEGIFRSVNFLYKSARQERNQLTIHLTFAVVSEPTYINKGAHRYTQKYSPAAAYLELIENANIDQFSLVGLVRAAKAEFRRGIFAIEPISTSKVPLIMTHGLNSDPLIWRYLTIALLNDPELSQKFQIWHYYYPSGPPPFFTAMKLRHRLASLLASINNPDLSKKAVFVGHSMGGIITHLLTCDSGYALWDSAFTERPDELKEEFNPELEEIFIFKPTFQDNTVFFLDTPHLGSNVATSPIGYISSWLVNLPHSFSKAFSAFTQRIGLNKITAAMQRYSAGPNSIQVLRPGHPMMQALSRLPVAGSAYSIIGSDNENTTCIPLQDCQNISDSVVDYNSAHFPDAEQEIIVQSNHNSFKSDKAIHFIKEKLKKMELPKQ